jgi:hypothetical protein
MADERKNGNGGMVRQIAVPLVVAAIVGLLVMYGTVRILETKMDAIQATVIETRQAQKDDGREVTDLKVRLSIVEERLKKTTEKVFDTDAWDRRKR